jgi:hypothetical protein
MEHREFQESHTSIGHAIDSAFSDPPFFWRPTIVSLSEILGGRDILEL